MDIKNCLKLFVSFWTILTLSIEAFGSDESISHTIVSTGKHIAKEGSKVFIGSKIQIDKGTDSTENDEDTGAIHNHDQIIILSGGSFTGGGKIVNYGKVEKDTERTSKRETYAARESEELKEGDALAESAYYDFTHRTGATQITEFYTADQATISKSITASTKEEYESDPSAEYITADESRVGVRVEPRGGFVQSSTEANKSYYLGTLAEKGGLTSIHSSTTKGNPWFDTFSSRLYKTN